MGTPLFYPLVKNEDGIYSDFANNRIAAFHVGAKGYLAGRLEWKGLLAYSENWGTFGNPYCSVKRQVYSMFELNWQSKRCLLLFQRIILLDVPKFRTSELILL